jgi:hypothetical protein
VYASPAVDVIKMFSIVTPDNDGNIPETELIMFYHKEFVEALKMFGYMKQPPSLLDLNVEIMRHGAVKVINQISFFPYKFLDWKNVDLNELFLSSDDPEQVLRSKMKLYENPIVERLLKEGLTEWAAKGWI